MDGWNGGIQEDPAPANASLGRRSSTGLLLRSPSKGKGRKKSVRFNNAVTVKVVPRVSQYPYIKLYCSFSVHLLHST